MGNAVSNPLAAAAGKKKANDAATQAQEGFNALTAGKTDEQKAQETRAKDRNATYEEKKKEREERKKKLKDQWAANKKG
eukprot:CAMPEP_0168250528 /NCGR_PEP_ID=MMETSP0141_2-20121125/2594_1 /TAXON_ID=44445 /ORGANISM="Pseudo-nitzschia australis, Strain 10249 10 AB" /LENGTH=78 /DNA_ID=CAMNT_0008186617 /DNA_START=148 /DNA_END=384 /DNA_ORIENTATION=-